MRTTLASAALLCAAALAGDSGIPAGWFPDLKAAKAEAAKTGKPIFLVTIWPPGV